MELDTNYESNEGGDGRGAAGRLGSRANDESRFMSRRNGPQTIPSDMIIRSFSPALAALLQHSFNNMSDFETAVNMASELYQRTHEVINTTDLNTLKDAYSSIDPNDNFLAYISLLHAILSIVDSSSSMLPSLLRNLTDIVDKVNPAWVHAVPERWIGAFRHAVRLAIDKPKPSQQQSQQHTSSNNNDNNNNSNNTNNNSSSSSTSISKYSLAISLIPTVYKACEKMITEPDELVPLHADYLALCIHAKYYRHAVKWIRQHRRLHMDPQITRLQATDVHLIYHYATWVLTGVKDYSAALQTCRLALYVPAPSTGPFFSIALHTYKLCSLLNALGTTTRLNNMSTIPNKSSSSNSNNSQKSAFLPSPSSHSTVLSLSTLLQNSSYRSEQLKKLIPEYNELLLAFDKSDVAMAKQIIESNREAYTKHEMMALVKQVLTVLHQKLLIKLSNSFVRMTLKEVADKVGLKTEDEAEKLIVSMVEQNLFAAKIDQKAKVVRLMERDIVDENQFTNQVSTEYMNQCVDVIVRLQRFREAVECDPEYIRKDTAGQANRGKQPSTANARAFASGGTGLGVGVAEIEEEFMR